MAKRQPDAYLRNRRPLKQQRLDKPPKPKMPEKGSLITVIHDGTHDLTRIKEIIERYGLDAEFKEIGQ